MLNRPSLTVSCVCFIAASVAVVATTRVSVVGAQDSPRPVVAVEVVDPSIGLRIRTDVKFDAVPLVDVLEFLATQGRMNMMVNWSALELMGIDRNTPVTLNLRGVNILTALRMTARTVSDQIGFDVDENILVVTTRELADARMVTRLYPIDDLLSVVPSFDDAPEFSLQSSSGGGGGSGGSGGGGGGGGLFGGGAGNGGASGGGNGGADGAELTRVERAEQIIQLLQATVEPDVWDVNGGRASMRYFAGNLIVTGPARVHGLFRAR